MVETKANFECDLGVEGNAGIPQTFDLDIQLKGNFTFSWQLAYETNDIKALCGHHFIYLKELVRRTQYGAIPVVPLDPERFLRFNDSNDEFDPQLSYIFNREIDISLDIYLLNSIFFSFANISNAVVDPTLSLMGGLYPNTKSNSYFGVINVFYVEIWMLIILTLLIPPFLLATESWIFKNKRSKEHDHLKSKFFKMHLWSVWNAMFMPTFNFRHLNGLTNQIIIAFLLVFKVLNSTLFSSQILSVTIEDPYYVIDSIEEFNNRSDLQPMLFMPRAYIENLENDEDVKHLVKRALSDEEESVLEYDFEALFRTKLDDLIDRIFVAHSHILLISPGDSEVIITLDTNKFKPISHISNKQYLDKVRGYVFHKNLDPMLMNVFSQILSDATETGLHSKCIQTGISMAYDMFGNKKFNYVLKEQSFQMELDEIKIVLGPFIIGICSAFLALLWEYSNDKVPAPPIYVVKNRI